MTAPHIYPLWYYCLGVLTTLLARKMVKKNTMLKMVDMTDMIKSKLKAIN